MKEQLILLFCILMSFAGISVGEEPSDLSSWEYPPVDEKTSFILSKALEDIASNITLWVDLRQEIDSISGLAWSLDFWKKIPFQPIVVIEAISRC